MAASSPGPADWRPHLVLLTRRARGGAADTFGFNVRAKCERGSLRLTNYLFPFVYHALEVAPAAGAPRTEKHYGGGETTFELQLRAFVAAVRHNEPYATSPDDAVANMKVVDAIYDAAGLGARRSASAN